MPTLLLLALTPSPSPTAAGVAAHPTWALLALLLGPLALALVGLGIVRLRQQS